MALRVDASALAAHASRLVAVLLAGVALGAATRPADDVVDRARASWTAFEAELGSVLADEGLPAGGTVA